MVQRAYMIIGRYHGAPKDFIYISAESSLLVNEFRALKASIKCHRDETPEEQTQVLMKTLKSCSGETAYDADDCEPDKEGKDETEDFLRCVVKDLQQKSGHIPGVLRKRFNEDARPTEDDLLESLVQLADKLKRIYIIVDAIDESCDRAHITRAPGDKSERGRYPRDLPWTVTPCVEIPMSGAGVKDGMRRLAHSELRKIQDWSEAMTARVETALVDRAQGMFRWLIKGEYRDFARTALALLCNPSTDIPSAEILVEASLYKIELGQIRKYDVHLLRKVCSCLVSVTRKKQARQGNIFIWPEEPEHRAALAHYTVKEYLDSRHAAEGEASFYALDPEFLRVVDLMVFFRGLQRFGIRAQVEAKRKYQVHPYDETSLRVTEHTLSQRRSELVGNEELVEFVLPSLKPSSQHFAYLKQQGGIRMAMRSNFPQWDKLFFSIEVRPLGPCAEDVTVLLNLVLLGWPEMAEKYLESPEISGNGNIKRREVIWTEPFSIQNKNYETLLGYVVRTRDRVFLNLFTLHGAFFDAESEVLFSLLQNFYVLGDDSDGALSFFKEVLKHSAMANPRPTRSKRQGPDPENPLPECFAFTPLQIAVAYLESEWVELLLEHGADSHGFGMKGGHVRRAFGGFIRENVDGGGERLLKYGLKKPLEICETATPPWENDDGSNQKAVNTARRQIRQALKSWLIRGSEEPDPHGGSMENPHVLS
ncbi:hypothetical protein PG994_009001 [Apiospora phragmitis]|uniref:Nephrocystin 3-like N-terminal domain-containing protein n=1 Tax=Apiospora phragmitis TaxID=2905665 RepID=A0ABR1UI21_9PEZI